MVGALYLAKAAARHNTDACVLQEVEAVEGIWRLAFLLKNTTHTYTLDL